MTPEEIKKIAEEVAHLRAFDGGYFPHEKEIREDYEVLLQWLTERFYLVEKGKAKKFYKKLEVDFCHVDEDNDWVVSEAIEEMESLFGPDIRKEEEV